MQFEINKEKQLIVEVLGMIVFRNPSEYEYNLVEKLLLKQLHSEKKEDKNIIRIHGASLGFLCFCAFKCTADVIVENIDVFTTKEFIIYTIAALPFLLLFIKFAKNVISPVKKMVIKKDDIEVCSGTLLDIEKTKKSNGRGWLHWGTFEDNFGNIFEEEDVLVLGITEKQDDTAVLLVKYDDYYYIIPVMEEVDNSNIIEVG